jgi:hypothetical protein
MRIVGYRPRRRVAAAAAATAAVAVAVAVVVAGVGIPVAAADPGDAAARQQIAAAFRAFERLPSVARGGSSLQGYDPAMRTALQQAGNTLLTGSNGIPTTVRETTGPASFVRSDEATVPLTITVKSAHPPPSYSVHYLGVALKTGGRWKVSWTTMCLLAESASHQQCPPTPRHLEAGDVLPSSYGSSSLAPGLVNPGPLAIAPDGGLLIADQGRNQILEWKGGVLSVVAGDGLEGYSGDGAPAVAAELHDPGEIAVGGSGTIYFVDIGNDVVRAVTPGGLIHTVAGNGSLGPGGDEGDGGLATSTSLDPSGVAVNGTGDLFVSSGSDIREVAPDGVISTFVRGGPPYGVDVSVGGTPTAFFPDSLAFDGQGDLIVFGFSPKVLFSVSPSGSVTGLADDYASALAPAPDGSVLVAEHNPGLDRVSDGVVSPLTFDARVTGLRNALVAEGIAETPDGVIYIDSEPGDGFTDQTGLYEIVDGVTHALDMSAMGVSSLPAVGATGFPSTMFPAPTAPHAPDAALTSCPSMTGVEPFTPAVEDAARQLLGFWNSGFSYNLHASDRSWWTGVLAGASGSGPFGRQTVGTVTPTAQSLDASAIEASCGRALVRDSLEVLMEPSAYDPAYQHVFVLDRQGTPLVFFAAT